MKIAILGYAHPFGENLYYGAEREIWYLMRELKKMKHEVVVFSVKGCNLPGFKFVEMPVPWKDDVDQYFHAVESYSNAYRFPFDIVHSYMASGNISQTIRERWPFCLEPFFGFHRWQNNVIAYSEKLKDVNGGKSTRIYFGIPEDYYPEPDYSHQDYLVWIGRIDIGKAPHIAIEAAKRANKSLVILGQSYHYPYFVDRIWPHIDNDRVIWLRCVNDAQKAKIMRNAAGFLSTNWSQFHEMLGIVNIESLACGCPVIGWAHATQTSAINHKGGEIICDGVHGFLNIYRDYSASEEEASIERAVQLINQLDQIDRRACYKLFKDRFTAREMAEHHVNYYQKVIANRTVHDITKEI